MARPRTAPTPNPPGAPARASRPSRRFPAPGAGARGAAGTADAGLWPNLALAFVSHLPRTFPEPPMGNKIVTEADRKATPRPAAPKGVTLTTHKGQKSSLERGTQTRSKKNPGKRPKSGG